jgi:DNA-binding NtrC family response regulator
LNGIDLMAKIRDVRPAVKTIIMSGKPEVADLVRDRGTFLQKPLDFRRTASGNRALAFAGAAYQSVDFSLIAFEYLTVVVT